MGRAEGGVEWVVTTAKTKRWHNANDRVYSGYDVHMYPQWANIPLQDLDRCVYQILTAVRFRAFHWHNFTSPEFARLAKGTLEKQIS